MRVEHGGPTSSLQGGPELVKKGMGWERNGMPGGTAASLLKAYAVWACANAWARGAVAAWKGASVVVRLLARQENDSSCCSGGGGECGWNGIQLTLGRGSGKW